MHRRAFLMAGIFPVLLVAVLPPEGVSGNKIHLTQLGTYCTDECRLQGASYRCSSTNKDGKEETMYCSPQRDQDQYGRKCYGVCDKWGYDFYWCSVWTGHAITWGYCGLDDLDYYTSTYHALCYDNCKFGVRSTYCHTDKGWDYCSVRPNVDYYGNECRPDHPCGQYGENYSWCNLKKGSWGFCGMIMHKKNLYTSSTFKSLCVNECAHHGEDYYWCQTLRGWDYCSPEPGTTSKGKSCRKNHPCDLNGESYYWCYYTENRDWDHCGRVDVVPHLF